MVTFLHRYERANTLFNNYLVSKYQKPVQSLKLKQIKVKAGLYKPNNMTFEHSFILSILTGKLFRVEYQLHGKRKRRTLSSTADILGVSTFYFLDKFVNEIITHTYDFLTPKYKKFGFNSKELTIRFRERLRIITEFDELVSAQMYDTHGGIYLPLTIHLCLNKEHSNYINETYYRMLQLPIILYKRKARAAFDDKYSRKWLPKL